MGTEHTGSGAGWRFRDFAPARRQPRLDQDEAETQVVREAMARLTDPDQPWTAEQIAEDLTARDVPAPALPQYLR